LPCKSRTACIFNYICNRTGLVFIVHFHLLTEYMQWSQLVQIRVLFISNDNTVYSLNIILFVVCTYTKATATSTVTLVPRAGRPLETVVSYISIALCVTVMCRYTIFTAKFGYTLLTLQPYHISYRSKIICYTTADLYNLFKSNMS
jgi:hypothetical protein